MEEPRKWYMDISYSSRNLSEDEYRALLCDPATWFDKSRQLYAAADAIIKLYYRDIQKLRNGITPAEEPKFYISMIGPWHLLMAFAIENAAKGIIVHDKLKKDQSLRNTATLKSLSIFGHNLVAYLRSAFKAKGTKMELKEEKFAEDLEAYARSFGKYGIGANHKDLVPHDVIMHSTPAECTELGHFDTIIGLYKKLDEWLHADVIEAHAEEFEGFRELEEKWGYLYRNDAK